MTTRACIIVADDDRAAAQALSRVLSHSNYEVLTAYSADGVREFGQQRSPDLLIADIHMPGNAKLELLQWEPVRKGHLPLMLVTGQPSVSTAVDALRMSAVDYVTKPIDPAYLLKRVEETLQRHRAEREAAAATAEIGRLLNVLHGRFEEPAPAQAPEPGADDETRYLSRLPPEQRALLSGREREVVVALAQHGSVASVSRTLHISPYTVRGHLASVFRKLGVRSQVELITKLVDSRPG